jgi:hypothetical protein
MNNHFRALLQFAGCGVRIAIHTTFVTLVILKLLHPS